MIALNKVDFYIQGRHLLEDVSFQIGPKQHVGLVGRNGTGKTTIFKIIQGKLHVDGGSVEIAKNWKVLSVDQNMPDEDLCPLEYLMNKDTERVALLKELEGLEDVNRMCEIYDRLNQIDAYTAEARAAFLLKGLGLTEEDQYNELKNLSGGYRMRVAIAAMLYQEPDIMLLDEPTNHLDLETTKWLEGFLKKYPKSFLMVSHDRDFLNNTVDSILHLKNKHINRYVGNFDTFIDTYTMQQQNIASQNAKLEEQRKHMMEFVNRFLAKATKAKQAQSRLKAIEKMKFIPLDPADPTVSFEFPEPETISPPLLSFEKVFLGYGDKVILKYISGTFSPEDRIALVGANGNGKSTFAKFLAGELKPLKGEIHRGAKLKIGFYRQDQFDGLDLEKTAYEHVSDNLKTTNNLEIRSHLGRFGFSGEKADQKVKELSGGERARLLFACLTAEKPNLLILDEPTNHLDIEMRESLIQSLNTYKGAVILITHDRNLLSKVANTIWVVKDQKITPFDGDINEYEKSLK